MAQLRQSGAERRLAPEALDDFVDALAHRIAALPNGVMQGALQAIDAAEASGPVPVLSEESIAHQKVYPSPDWVVERLRAVVDAGAQTRDGELELEALLDQTHYPATV
jgi:hypothetical protein